VFMNDWLVDEGFLSVSPRAAASMGQRMYGHAKNRLSVPARQALRPLFGKVLERAKGAALYGDFDWSRSRAYAHMQPAVRLNLRGREPSGIVDEGQRAGVLSELSARAMTVRLPDGRPVFTDAIPSDQAYAGDAEGGPDLVLELGAGMHIRSRNTTGRAGSIHRLDPEDVYFPSGVHAPRGMFAACGRGIERLGRVEDGDIRQVTPSLLAIMGVPAPPLDGQPFEFVRGIVNQVDDYLPPDATPLLEELNDVEEAEVLERLRGLGYVD
jgi:predicted AlkP superfamily phosphohydrolase/phosphomutase